MTTPRHNDRPSNDDSDDLHTPAAKAFHPTDTHIDSSTDHIPVMLEQVLAQLNPQPGESYLDVTAGYGGHAREVLQRIHPTPTDAGTAVLVDRDTHAVAALNKTFAREIADETVIIRNQDFLSASQDLSDAIHRGEGQRFDMILADLGVSSPHLNQADRGFAINAEGPLDMRMDQRQTLTAADIANTYSADELADILKRYGEEPKARAIASAIIANRPVNTTAKLAATASKVWSRQGKSKVHPATRTFQALRIAVNDELQLVAKSLPLWIDMLKPGGRLAVISFHSLEDRLVKQAFADAGRENDYDAKLTLLTKRPVTASPEETVFNPRARSAKLRAAAKK